MHDVGVTRQRETVLFSNRAQKRSTEAEGYGVRAGNRCGAAGSAQGGGGRGTSEHRRVHSRYIHGT